MITNDLYAKYWDFCGRTTRLSLKRNLSFVCQTQFEALVIIVHSNGPKTRTNPNAKHMLVCVHSLEIQSIFHQHSIYQFTHVNKHTSANTFTYAHTFDYLHRYPARKSRLTFGEFTLAFIRSEMCVRTSETGYKVASIWRGKEFLILPKGWRWLKTRIHILYKYVFFFFIFGSTFFWISRTSAWMFYAQLCFQSCCELMNITWEKEITARGIWRCNPGFVFYRTPPCVLRPSWLQS